MGFNHGTKHLSGQTQAIIRQREENDKILRESKEKMKKHKELEQLKEIKHTEETIEKTNE